MNTKEALLALWSILRDPLILNLLAVAVVFNIDLRDLGLLQLVVASFALPAVIVFCLIAIIIGDYFTNDLPLAKVCVMAVERYTNA